MRENELVTLHVASALTGRRFDIEATIRHEPRSWDSPGDTEISNVAVAPEGREFREIRHPSDALLGLIIDEGHAVEDEGVWD